MIENEFYDGILYQVEYRPELSNNDYTQRKVYYIKTDDDNWDHARKAIISIIEDLQSYEQDYLWSDDLYHIKNKLEPSIINGLHPYYTFSYDENIDVYVFTLIIPYDD